MTFETLLNFVIIMNMKKIFIYAAAIVCAGGSLLAIETSAMTVFLSGFNQEMLTQNSTIYEVSSTGARFTIPETSTQKIIDTTKRRNRVTIKLKSGVASSEISHPSVSDTADTRFLNLSSKEIQKASQQFRKSQSITDDVGRFVYQHITDKSYGIPLIPADAVYRHRAGDCTEHTVLAIALFRANDIPARAVVGLLFEQEFLGLKNRFVFHMWAEAYVNGEWVIVDATRPDSTRPNRYIALAFHSLRSEAPVNYISAIASLENMRIRYIDGM